MRELTATSSTFAHYHISGNIVNRINLAFLILALLSAFINSFNLTVLAEGFLTGPCWRVKPTNIQSACRRNPVSILTHFLYVDSLKAAWCYRLQCTLARWAQMVCKYWNHNANPKIWEDYFAECEGYSVFLLCCRTKQEADWKWINCQKSYHCLNVFNVRLSATFPINVLSL